MNVNSASKIVQRRDSAAAARSCDFDRAVTVGDAYARPLSKGGVFKDSGNAIVNKDLASRRGGDIDIVELGFVSRAHRARSGVSSRRDTYRRRYGVAVRRNGGRTQNTRDSAISKGGLV